MVEIIDYSKPYDTVESILRKLATYIRENDQLTRDTMVRLNNSISTGLDAVNVHLTDLTSTLTEDLSNYDDKVIRAIGEMYEGVTNWIGDSVQGVGNIARSIYNEAEGFFQSGYDSLTASFDDIWQGAKDVYSEIEDYTNSTLEGLKNNLNDVMFYWGSQISLSVDKAYQSTQEVLHNSNKFVEKSINSITQLSESLVGETQLFFATLYHDVKDDLVAATDVKEGELEKGISKMFDTYRKTLNKLMSEEVNL
jgi:hypothetical protein